MAASLECKDCHDLSKPRTVEAMNEKCMDCHSDEVDKYQGMLAGWKKETDALLKAASENADANIKGILEPLRKAGPMHNMEATRKILGAGAKPPEQQQGTAGRK